MGTIINGAAVVIGSLIGMALKGGLPSRFEKMMMQALGISTIFIGVSGTLQRMMKFSVDAGGAISVGMGGTMTIIISLIIGSLIGELLNLEQFTGNLGENIKKRVLKGREDAKFVEGFVSATLVICVGAMAVVGAITDGLTGDYSMLLAKSILDFVIVIIFGSSYGIGVLFSAVPLVLYQGIFTVFARFISPVMTDTAVSAISMVGNAIILGVGVNIAFGKKFKVANMLPALLIAFLLAFFSEKFNISFFLS